MSIIRGLKIYRVGGDVANPTYGITVEYWTGEDGVEEVTVMTIREDGDKLAKDWDSGSSITSDSRAMPKTPTSSGGTIKLLNNGWYTNFLADGYNLTGCRIDKTWEGLDNIGSYIVQSVSVGVGIITLQLSNISDSMNADMTATVGGVKAPFVVGNFTGVELQKIGEPETALFGGVKFRNAFDTIPVINDYAGSPASYEAYIVPTQNETLPDSLVFPANSFCRVSSGVGEGFIFRIAEGEYAKDDLLGAFYYPVMMLNDYGIATEDDNEIGIKVDLADTLIAIGDIAVFEFFTLDQKFLASAGSTISNVVGPNGNEITSYTKTDEVVSVSPQYGEGAVLNVEWVRNVDGYDFTEFSGYSRAVGSHRYDFYPSVGSEAGAASYLNDKLITNGQEFVTCIDAVGAGWYTEEIPENMKGICANIRVEITGVSTLYNASLDIICVAEYAPQGDYAGMTRTQKILTYSGQFVSDFGYNPDGRNVEFANFGIGYFDEPVAGIQNDPFDDRTSPVDTVYLRGREKLTFPDFDPKAKPSRIYVFVFCNNDASDGETVSISVRELGFFGDAMTSFDKIDSITADVGGYDYTIISEAVEAVAFLQDWSNFPDVQVIPPADITPVKCNITDSAELRTSAALDRLLRESWHFGYMRNDGKYVTVPAYGKLGVESTVPDSHTFSVPSVGLDSDTMAYELDDVPTFGTVKYQGGSVSVLNTDQPAFMVEYVTGVSDTISAEIVWNMARSLFLKTGIMKEIRQDLSELKWIYDPLDVLEYMRRVFEWSGGDEVGAKNVLTVPVNVADIRPDGVLLPWYIGDVCKVYIPTITTSGDYYGVITSVVYDAGECSAKITARVAQATPAPITWQEVGTDTELSVTLYEETATAINNYLEVGIQ